MEQLPNRASDGGPDQHDDEQFADWKPSRAAVERMRALGSILGPPTYYDVVGGKVIRRTS